RIVDEFYYEYVGYRYHEEKRNGIIHFKSKRAVHLMCTALFCVRLWMGSISKDFVKQNKVFNI
ncbi:hypothetical protein, partial [Bulleidia extructa]|uniref:hypothetical protein n=1 Tax=Bulleidia extructa TaxID=118748 RepID=UPI003BF1EF40